MTQKEKELLLKDLCGRLPYDVKGRVFAENTKGEYDMNGDMIFFDSPFDVTLNNINTSTKEIHVIATGNEDIVDFIENQQTLGDPYTIDEFKPYLFPFSSMTKEQYEDFIIVSGWDGDIEDIRRGKFSCVGSIGIDYIYDTLDWLNRNHFDYRGLIDKGLAIDATDKNIY